MPALPEKDQQILATHAGLVHAVVRACHNRELMPQLEQVLKMSEENGWQQLVSAIRKVFGGSRYLTDEATEALALQIARGSKALV